MLHSSLSGERNTPLSVEDYRITPQYPKQSPLDDVLKYVPPGTDQFIVEKYAAEIAESLVEWGKALRTEPPALNILQEFLDPSIQAALLIPTKQKKLRSEYGVEVYRRIFSPELRQGRDNFLREVRAYLASLTQIETAEMQITGIVEKADYPLSVGVEIRYDFVGVNGERAREERIGFWHTEWSRVDLQGWQATRWKATEETLSCALQPAFIDVSEQALGHLDSYKMQMLHGVDYWRTILDGATGIDVYGNTGLATGDYDNDGLDDLYICQPAGLPNRLYRNRGDGTFEDFTETAGVGVLDGTACAIFADFENKGLQDLLVVCTAGPLLFLNQGNGKFSLKRDAFQFANPPAGTFTHAALADYDGDGRLDIYFCLYNYYAGLDQYRYPVPYFDARNGPPNFLFHNKGNGIFQDQTQIAGLNVENDRYSFACTWGDFDSDGRPDLYVVNDFGRNNLYKNNGDGTFAAISAEAQVNEPGAGMSACWLDFDNDGRQDLYAAGMWVAAGMRIFGQQQFHGKEPETIRELYQRHMLGNSLYRNLGNSRFENVARQAGVEMGRWSWSTDAWDFDHDGYPDIYVANGYVSGSSNRDVSSFFWRQVVANSPATAIPSENYERGWNAINELIRSEATWNGYERNVFYRNNQDGTFSDVSGTLGLDFPDDSRAFVLADIDHDGRLEIVLKNRTAPQIRILHNSAKELGNSIAFRLQGAKSNRDGIGAAITIEIEGRRQTKLLQAGSGFLSQHSKEIFFGVGNATGPLQATIRWPSGVTTVLESLPINHRIEIKEGFRDFSVTSFERTSPFRVQSAGEYHPEALPSSVETWLLEPLEAPDFSLPELSGAIIKLSKLRGRFVLLTFWGSAASESIGQLRDFRKNRTNFTSHDIQVLCLNVDDSQNSGNVRSLAAKESFSLPILISTAEISGVYNILNRYLFDRRRDLGLPTSLLLDREGMIVKIYQGKVDSRRVLEDLPLISASPAGRLRNGLPMKGTAYFTEFRRNDFTYGVALYRHGYLEAAIRAFKNVIASQPENAQAYYNLGTLYLTGHSLENARDQLEHAIKLQPEYAEAWNNLGMVSAQQGQEADALRQFETALQFRPTYVTALLNSGNLLRKKGDFDKAQNLLTKALEENPEDADANYSMGMLLARKNQLQEAAGYLEKTLTVRPDYADALNNLGVLLVRLGKYPEAQEKFEICIQAAPTFDQGYLNLARLYVFLNEKEKAREVLQKLLRLQPEHQLARKALEMIN